MSAAVVSRNSFGPARRYGSPGLRLTGMMKTDSERKEDNALVSGAMNILLGGLPLGPVVATAVPLPVRQT
jgi:hypothetical protein